MEKALLTIHAPSVCASYDAFTPTEVPISELIAIIAQGVCELTDGKYGISGMETLSLKSPELLLNPKLTLKDYSVHDGMQLYLI